MHEPVWEGVIEAVDVAGDDQIEHNPVKFNECMHAINFAGDKASASWEIRHPGEFIESAEEITEIDQTVNDPDVNMLISMDPVFWLQLVESEKREGGIKAPIALEKYIEYLALMAVFLTYQALSG